MATKLGERIRQLRIERKMLLRHLASKLDVDSSILSKVERGDRQLRKGQIHQLAEFLHVDEEDLLTLWLADQVLEVLSGEKLAEGVLKKVSSDIKKSK